MTKIILKLANDLSIGSSIDSELGRIDNTNKISTLENLQSKSLLENKRFMKEDGNLYEDYHPNMINESIKATSKDKSMDNTPKNNINLSSSNNNIVTVDDNDM